ncbi:DUF5065 family protein [Bacillus cereus group sp. MYBK15-3]|uniref:DUF5065 family protein n=1 Tax=Bacillus cereus group TaxID=86661 RepID=UPI001C8C1735|nr:DUF5065 family protein [Bacillus cereus]MBX9158733.1 DUF5065 family protein [Bacillus cereus]
MKKLKTLALIGALTIGGFTASGLFSSNQAAAATPQNVQYAVADDWGFPTYQHVHHNADYRQELNLGTLRIGSTLDINVEVGGVDNGILKLYYIDPNGVSDYGDLQRYKTIYGAEAGHHNFSRFTTPITNVYPPGDYVAVLKVGDSFYYGGKFKITK